MRGKRGQMILIGILVLVMSVIIFIAMIPALSSMFNESRKCTNLNCGGYVDRQATAATCGANNGTYDPSLDEDTLSCTIIDLGIPLLVLGVLVGLITLLLRGGLTKAEEPQPQYGYGGGY